MRNTDNKKEQENKKHFKKKKNTLYSIQFKINQNEKIIVLHIKHKHKR